MRMLHILAPDPALAVVVPLSSSRACHGFDVDGSFTVTPFVAKADYPSLGQRFDDSIDAVYSRCFSALHRRGTHSLS